MTEPLYILRWEATTSAFRKGHELRWGEPIKHGARRYQNAVCLRCQAEAQIITMPLPNEINIGGTAVALNCPIKPEKDTQ